MDPKEVLMHYRAARAAGEESACGNKIRHEEERKAERHALNLNRRPAVLAGEKNRVEPYPCPFCFFWHVGRKMTTEEREKYGEK
jgi:hypothetical protein